MAASCGWIQRQFSWFVNAIILKLVLLFIFLTLWTLKWPPSNFSLQYHPWIKHQSHENNGNDHQLKELLIIKEILLGSTLGNGQRAVWRICKLMLGYKGLLELTDQLENEISRWECWFITACMIELLFTVGRMGVSWWATPWLFWIHQGGRFPIDEWHSSSTYFDKW